jgi:S1-C subfamily serine protease
MDELVAYLVMNSRPGDEVRLLIVRGGDSFEVPVALTARPENASAPTPCGQ